MPKSRNRKDHKKKVANRNTRIKIEQKQMMDKVEELKEQYVDAMAKKSQESSEVDSGDVPFTLGGDK
jgi:hypothetical protein|tara:strand:+ start:644 stop:844 length:201 start_codon:yes stop_codon:yes gene_type:complete